MGSVDCIKEGPRQGYGSSHPGSARGGPEAKFIWQAEEGPVTQIAPCLTREQSEQEARVPSQTAAVGCARECLLLHLQWFIEAVPPAPGCAWLSLPPQEKKGAAGDSAVLEGIYFSLV